MKKALPLLFSKLTTKVLKNCASRFYLFFTLSSVLLISCETQENLTHTGQKFYESKQISLGQFINETGDNNFDRIVSIKYNSNNILGKSTSNNYDLTDFDIDTNVINRMSIFDKNTYTFRVKPKNYNGTNLFNLIYYKKNNTWEKTIIEMKPNAVNLYKLQNGLTTKFEGEIKQIFNSETKLIKSKFAKSSVNAMTSNPTNCSSYTIVEENCFGCVGKCDKCYLCVTYTSFFLCESGGDSGGGFSSGINLDQGNSGSTYSFPDANAPDTTFFEPNINNPYGELDEIYKIKFNEFINSLENSNVRLLEFLNQNPTLKNQIFNFLIDNNFSNNSNVFAVEILNQIKQNPSLNLSIEASFKSPLNIDFGTISNHTPEGAKFNEVYTALTQSQEFRKLFETIFKDNKRFNVKFEIADRAYEDNDPLKKEVHATTSQNDITKIITIRISKQILTAGNSMSQTNIENAKTILHECIHAYLFVKAGNPSTGIDFVKLLNSMYPTPNEQHDFMYNNMVPIMQKVLGEIRDLVTTASKRAVLETYTMHPTANPLTSTPFNWQEFYKYLSYSGLDETFGFKNDFPLNSDLLRLNRNYIDAGKNELDR